MMKQLIRVMMGVALLAGSFVDTAKARQTNVLTFAFTITSNAFANLPACTIELDMRAPRDWVNNNFFSAGGTETRGFYPCPPFFWRMIRQTDSVTLVSASITNFGTWTDGVTGGSTTDGVYVIVSDGDSPGSEYLRLGADGLGSPGSYNGYSIHGFVAQLSFTDFDTLSGSSIPLPLPRIPVVNLESFSMKSNGVVVTRNNSSNIKSQSFYVRPTNTISVTSASFSPSITFVTEPFVRYQPQWTPVITPDAWTNMGGTFLTDTPQTITVADTNNAPGQAFYRVEIVR
jgi:hypothetical protein